MARMDSTIREAGVVIGETLEATRLLKGFRAIGGFETDELFKRNKPQSK